MTGNNIDLLITLTTLILSVICIISGVLLRLFYHRKIALEYLGWGTFLAAIWNISDSGLGQILSNASAADYVAFFTLLFMPLPFFLYLNLIQEKRYQYLYYSMTFATLLEFAVFTILHVAKLRSFKENSNFILFLFILFLVLTTAAMLADLRHQKIRNYLPSAIGMGAILLICFIRFISYFFLHQKLRDHALPFGLIFLQLLAIASAIHEWIDMERKKQQALSANEAKGRFLANMSHEIRTPINAVLGMDAMILRETTEPQIKEYALDIQNAGQSLLSLINDILDLSKIESGKLEILEEEYDFSSLIHDIINMISMKAENKGLDVHLFIDETLPSRLWGDDVRVRQVLVNLMNNAVKYTEEGSVTLTVSKNPNSETGQISLTFQVKDTGIGIKEEDIPKLFAEFERIEEQRNRNIEGTGLGMSITTQLLDLMGSHLQVESIYGKGSNFYFTLEQKIIDAEPIGNLKERIRRQANEYSYQAMLTAPDAHLLVVDDNALNRRVFRNLLKETQVQIDEAGGGMECLKMAQEKHYDLIFLDHMMPDMDGIETLHRLQADDGSPCQSVPVIALTANAISGAKEMYLGEGFHSFLSKPINPEKLEKLLLDTLPKDKIAPSKPIQSTKDLKAPLPSGTSSPNHDFPEIDGIDWEYALLHLKDPEFLLETIRDFYRTMDTNHMQLQQFFEMIQSPEAEQTSDERKEALRQFRVQVHSMKSASAMIGATSLFGIAKMLEYAASDSRTDVLIAVTPYFLEEWQHMKERLRSLAEESTEHTDTEKPSADLQILKEYFPMLEQAMQNMDIDTADEIMQYLEKFQYPASVSPLIEQLGISVANLNAEQTTEIIQKLNNI